MNFSQRQIILIVLVTGLPLSLSLWTGNVVISSIFGTKNVSIARWISSVFMPLLFIYWGLKRNSLSTSGAVAGFFVGFIITLSNYAFLACLMAFFVTSSKATKFRSHLKSKLEENFAEGGKRNWVQVLSNGVVGSMLAFIYAMDCGCREQPLDLMNQYRCSLLTYGFLGAFSCSNGDTWASEFGTVVNLGQPYLITTLKRVPRGTNGGVSLAGIIASMLGGGCIGLSYYIALLVSLPSHIFQRAPPQWPVILLGAVGGLLGSLIDSFLGATIQYSGINEEERIVEHPGPGVKRISGRHILDNHGVNLISTLLTSLTLPYLALYFS